MDRRELIGAGLAAAVVAAAVPTEAAAFQAPVLDRNGNVLTANMIVNVPCVIKTMTPSLNPAATTLTLVTIQSAGVSGYGGDGLELTTYAWHVVKT